MDPVTWQEPERLVGDARFRAPPLPEGVQPRGRVGFGPFYEVVELVG